MRISIGKLRSLIHSTLSESGSRWTPDGYDSSGPRRRRAATAQQIIATLPAPDQALARRVKASFDEITEVSISWQDPTDAESAVNLYKKILRMMGHNNPQIHSNGETWAVLHDQT